jgi:hypothetical protein
MAAHQVALQLADLIGPDRDLGQGAEAGVHAVHPGRLGAATSDALHDRARRLHALTRAGRQHD